MSCRRGKKRSGSGHVPGGLGTVRHFRIGQIASLRGGGDIEDYAYRAAEDSIKESAPRNRAEKLQGPITVPGSAETLHSRSHLGPRGIRPIETNRQDVIQRYTPITVLSYEAHKGAVKQKLAKFLLTFREMQARARWFFACRDPRQGVACRKRTCRARRTAALTCYTETFRAGSAAALLTHAHRGKSQ